MFVSARGGALNLEVRGLGSDSAYCKVHQSPRDYSTSRQVRKCQIAADDRSPRNRAPNPLPYNLTLT